MQMICDIVKDLMLDHVDTTSTEAELCFPHRATSDYGPSHRKNIISLHDAVNMLTPRAKHCHAHASANSSFYSASTRGTSASTRLRELRTLRTRHGLPHESIALTLHLKKNSRNTLVC